MRHLSERLHKIHKAQIKKHQAQSERNGTKFNEAIAELEAAEQMEERYDCIECKLHTKPENSIVLMIHGIKITEKVYGCKSCNGLVTPSEPHCKTCSKTKEKCADRQKEVPIEEHKFIECDGKISEHLNNVWIHECTCRGKAEETNARSIVYCKKCAEKLGIINYIGKR